MSTDPATSAAQEVAERARRYGMILDPEVLAEVIRDAVEAARPIIEAEAREPVYGDPPESLMHSVDAELRAERDRAVEERDAAIAERDRARHYALRLTRARAAERPEPGTLSDEGYADVRAVNEAAAARRAAVRTEPEPAELLDARHDGPDLTGPLMGTEPEQDRIISASEHVKKCSAYLRAHPESPEAAALRQEAVDYHLNHGYNGDPDRPAAEGGWLGTEPEQ